MNNTSTILKDVERFYLSLSKKGIMLSSKDYHLISEWIESGISKEQILKGIRKTFESKDNNRIRGLSDCTEFVEIGTKKEESKTNKPDTTVSSENDYLVGILSNFSKIIENSHNDITTEFIKTINDELRKLINGKSEDMFSGINQLEEQFFKQLPDYLSSDQLENYKKELNQFLSSGEEYINEKSKNKALNNFSKNFIIDKYLGCNPFEI